jgi:tRNA threonylcarbamoyladenosine biosynthesis protein TsaB
MQQAKGIPTGMVFDSNEILLGFESSGGKASVAISRGSVILARTEHVAQHGHATWMLTLARDAFASAGLAPRDCSAVLAGRGPGSFTGTRVALAAAKGMGLALSVPVFGLSSLEAMASVVADGTHPVVVITDSRRGSFFVDMRHPDGRPMEAVQDLEPDQIVSTLDKASTDWVVIGHIVEFPGVDAITTHALIEDDPDATHLCSFFSQLDDDRKADLPLDPLYLSAPLLGPGVA